MGETSLIVYGTSWCGDCRRARRFLDNKQIPYSWIDIDRDKTAETFVKQHNRGNRSVPTIVFPDGVILVEPSTLALAKQLGIDP